MTRIAAILLALSVACHAVDVDLGMIDDITWNLVGSEYVAVFGGGAPVIDPDLKLWWMFDTNEGTNALDSTTNSNNGNLVGGAFWTNEVGGCVYLDGTNDEVASRATAILNAVTNFTVTCWIKTFSIGLGDGIMSTKGTQTAGLKAHGATAARFNLVTSSGAVGTGKISPGNWTFISGVYTQNSTYGYWAHSWYTGTTFQVSNTVYNWTAVKTHIVDDVWRLGNDEGGKFIGARFKDVRLYARPLSTAELSGIVTSTKATYGY